MTILHINMHSLSRFNFYASELNELFKRLNSGLYYFHRAFTMQSHTA